MNRKNRTYNMKILISGGTGFIGKALVRSLLDSGYEVIVLGRSIPKIKFCFGETVGAWSFRDLELSKDTVDAVINLSGEILTGIWTQAKKAKIIDSRVGVTKRIVAFCIRQQEKGIPIRIFQASAVGIYGTKGERTYFEETPIPEATDFLSQVARAWEEAAHEAIKHEIPTVIMRFGIVFDPNGGMLEYMLPAFRAGFGFVLGSGEQKISWIIRSDLLKAIQFLLTHPELNGAFNLVAKEPINQKDFARLFAKYLKRPLWLRIPRFLIRLCLGQMGDTLLFASQVVEPYRLNEAGFEFDYPNLNYYFARGSSS